MNQILQPELVAEGAGPIVMNGRGWLHAAEGPASLRRLGFSAFSPRCGREMFATAFAAARADKLTARARRRLESRAGTRDREWERT